MNGNCLRLLSRCLFLLLPLSGCSPNESKREAITESKAIKIAEREFVKRYGKRVLKQRPWIISETNNMYMIRGTLRTLLGGVAMVEIRKSDGSVIRCTHGQ